ncbi:DinB family protein [Solitalea lacus]|uniref:DinB family protein n=1 Tax=Solitalea lacus TaxID=2911172 RepID=UPI001EDC0D76|nr:DinB family protein [Solitalea lacus]UKJ09024.1 DUF1572 domain-containing protein [Solitalea lacus]
MVQFVKLFLKRDLEKLSAEVEQYNIDENLWRVEPVISNSGGNLCLHLVGNLNHFIGHVLGNTGYVRNRDLEFSLKNVSKSELITMINETIMMIDSVLAKVSPEQLKEKYPIEVFGEPMTTEYFLVHLVTHLSYHLGQVNYHRRLLDN